MKNIITNSLKYCSVAIVGISFFSCGPNVYFKKALPPDVEATSVIPDKYCGLYFFESDSTRIIVQADMIITESIINYRTTLSKIEESDNCKISDIGVHLRGRKECFPFEYVSGDTILVKVSEMDTLFSFLEEDVLKLYEDKIYLNFLNAKNEWITMVLMDGDDEGFVMYLLNVDNKERVVKSITDNYTSSFKNDSTEIFIIDPTALEFKKLMQRKHLSFYDKIIPLKIDLNEK